MFTPPVCWRSEPTKASPTRPRPGGSLVPRAKTTSASGQLSAEATGAALGETSRPAAVTSAEAPRPTQRPADRTLLARGLRMRLENTPKFYPHGGQGAPCPAIPYCPMASHSYCPNGNSKYANDNIYQLTSWPSQYLVPTMGSCHTYQGYPTMRPTCSSETPLRREFCLRPGIFG